MLHSSKVIGKLDNLLYNISFINIENPILHIWTKLNFRFGLFIYEWHYKVKWFICVTFFEKRQNTIIKATLWLFVVFKLNLVVRGVQTCGGPSKIRVRGNIITVDWFWLVLYTFRLYTHFFYIVRPINWTGKILTHMLVYGLWCSIILKSYKNDKKDVICK